MINWQEKLRGLESDNKKIIFIIGVFVVILCVDIAFLFKAQFKGLKTASSKIVKLKKDLVALKKDLENLDNDKMRQNAIISKAKTFIRDSEMPALLEYISEVANQYGVKIIQARPLKDSKSKAEVISKIRLTPYTINLDLSCPYHPLGKFINSLENGKYFIAVEDLRIIRNSSDYFNHNINIVLKTYAKK